MTSATVKYPYFSGCTMHTKGRAFNESGLAAARKLGFELEELKDWTCCGATFPLSEDYDMALSSPVRALSHAEQEGDTLVSLCAVCHNVLKRTNHVMQNNEERRAKVTGFIQEEYNGNVDVLHYLEILRDRIGFDHVSEKVEKPLTGLKVGAYYGCLLLRPPGEMAMDDPHNPTIIEDLIIALGAEPVDFPMKTDCCGAFQVVHSDATATRCSRAIIDSARAHGADLIATACPLCQFNIEDRQREMSDTDKQLKPMPVLYFTELMAMALGVGERDGAVDADSHYVDPRPALSACCAAGQPTAEG